MNDLNTIKEMFSYQRPMGSVTETLFIERFLLPLGFERDAHQNLVLTIGPPPYRTMFSSHVDTVARKEGIATLHYDGQSLSLSKRDKAQGFNCLGADDTAGIWLMTEMIRAGIPGLYVIHHGEESGGIGSSALAAEQPAHLFEDLAHVVAFDRAGTRDIITHQCAGRTASDEFAKALADQLRPLDYKPSPDGVYTDSYEYSLIVPECTNLSVGYYRQHTSSEYQDVPFLIDLRDALLEVDWNALPAARDPEAEEPAVTASIYPWWNDEDEFEDMIRDYPDVAVRALQACGITQEEFATIIFEETGDYFYTRNRRTA